MSAPRYSILIPTRNGVRYLPYAVESVLAQDYPDFELIVSDNHSGDGTAEYLATIRDPRFVHTRPPEPLSMTAHFEFLVAKARGRWITTLGDDDGLMPFFFEKAQTLDLDGSGVDAVVFERAYYFWDGCQELYGDRVVNYPPARGAHLAENRMALLLCVASIMNYMQLPQLYTTGLVKREFVERIKRATGKPFFVGRSPDAGSAVALALHAPRHLHVDDPLFWTGTSPKSVGFAHSFEDKKPLAAEFSQLNRNDDIAVTSRVPDEILRLQDHAVVLYDALLVNPGASWVWSTRPIRNLFLAGLVLKDPKLLPLIREAYKGRLFGWELDLGKKAVEVLRRRYERSGNAVKDYVPGACFGSDDRDAFPTLREASAEVLRRRADETTA